MTPDNLYIIGDTHFQHRKIIDYCNRPSDFSSLIIKNWNHIIKPTDTVLHLGDFMFPDRELNLPFKQQFRNIIDKLNGIKILIKGNHDKCSCSWYMNNGFHLCGTEFVSSNIIFTHHPQPLQLSKYRMNIHAHIHIPKFENNMTYKWNRLFSLELEEYKPILLTEFLEKTKSGDIYYKEKCEEHLKGTKNGT